MLAEKLGAEVGYSRARVMNGGVDAEKVIGISGHLLAPEVCIVVGASGAAALMAGVRNSKLWWRLIMTPALRYFHRQMLAWLMTGKWCWRHW